MRHPRVNVHIFWAVDRSMSCLSGLPRYRSIPSSNSLLHSLVVYSRSLDESERNGDRKLKEEAL